MSQETNQKLQLLKDYDMLMMFERRIRGGITHISNRYAEANKYMKDYNPDKPSSCIQYLDANNLYGWAMSQKLPTHRFKWMNNCTKSNVLELLKKEIQIKVIYLKSIWTTQKNYGNLIMIILSHKRK